MIKDRSITQVEGERSIEQVIAALCIELNIRSSYMEEKHKLDKITGGDITKLGNGYE